VVDVAAAGWRIPRKWRFPKLIETYRRATVQNPGQQWAQAGLHNAKLRESDMDLGKSVRRNGIHFLSAIVLMIR
jgi:hypothetical protein